MVSPEFLGGVRWAPSALHAGELRAPAPGLPVSISCQLEGRSVDTLLSLLWGWIPVSACLLRLLRWGWRPGSCGGGPVCWSTWEALCHTGL